MFVLYYSRCCLGDFPDFYRGEIPWQVGSNLFAEAGLAALFLIVFTGWRLLQKNG